MKIRFWLPILVLVGTLALVLISCNAFDPLDSPSNDAQYLSAARAYFDAGDFEKAREFYAKLSSEYAEVKASETAFTQLDDNGAGMGIFMETFGTGGGGAALTKLAERMAQDSPGSQAKRMTMLRVYQTVNSITANAPLRGLVRFLSSLALAAEMLSEEANDNGGDLLKTQLAINPEGCQTVAEASCNGGGATSCGKPTGATIDDSTALINDLGSAAALTAFDVANPTLGMIMSALRDTQTALTELQAGGKFSAGAGSFVGKVSGLQANAQCYRQFFITTGVGE